MDYNESAHKVDTAFDTLFRSLDVLESRQDDDAVHNVVEWWKEYKTQLKRHTEEHSGTTE
jgi:hypothetical protein